MYLRLNNKPILTDKNGNFSFSDVKPGEYFLYLDESQLGFGKISIPKIPLKLKVIGGQKEYIEIVITNAGSINGRIIKADKSQSTSIINSTSSTNNYAIKENGQTLNPINGQNHKTKNNLSSARSSDYLSDNLGLESIYVEITGPNGKERRFTDKQGNFYFEGLQPGNYSLLVYENNLPQFRYLKKKLYEFKLAPGQNVDFAVDTFKKDRPVTFATNTKTTLIVENIETNDLKDYAFTGRLLKELEAEPDVSSEYCIDLMLGLNYYRINKYYFAIDAFKNALNSETKTEDALLLLGLSYLKLGNQQKAFDYFKKITARTQSSLPATIANEYLGKTIRIKSDKTPAFSIHFNDGLEHFGNKNFKKAMEAFSKSIYSSSDNFEKADSYSYLGQCFYNLEKYTEAIKVLNSAVKLGTKNTRLEALYWSGLSYLKTDDKDVSKEILAKVAVLSSDQLLIESSNSYLSQIYLHY